MRLFIIACFTLVGSLVLAQPKKTEEFKFSGDQFADVVEQSFAAYYAEYAKKQNESYESVIAALNYADGQEVTFSDEIYRKIDQKD